MSEILPAVKRWYEHGVVLSVMDSREEWKNSSNDCVIKRLVAFLVQNVAKEYELVLVVEVEVISVVDGEDDGFFEPGREVYRIPFPSDSKTRKRFLRSCTSSPKFFVA